MNKDSILRPLFVFKNYGSEGEDTNKCFCSIPQEKWDSLVPNISEQEEKGRHGRMKLEPGGEVCVVG